MLKCMSVYNHAEGLKLNFYKHFRFQETVYSTEDFVSLYLLECFIMLLSF